MRISDIIRGVLDLIDSAEQPEPQVRIAVAVPAEQDQSQEELLRIKQIAGLLDDGGGQFGNTPTEKYAGIDAVTANGADINKSKHPSDIRSNSVSMYPNYQAERK